MRVWIHPSFRVVVPGAIAALAVLVALSGVARAESETYGNATNDSARVRSCAEATTASKSGSALS